MNDGPIPEEARQAIAALPGGPWTTILRIAGAIVLVVAVKKLDAWASTQFAGVPRWLVAVCALALLLLTVFALFRIGTFMSQLFQSFGQAWQRSRARIDQLGKGLGRALSNIHDGWFFGGAFTAVVLSCLAVMFGSEFDLLPSKGWFSAPSLLFLGFLVASTCIGLCKSINPRVWAVILFIGGLGLWCFSASIG